MRIPVMLVAIGLMLGLVMANTEPAFSGGEKKAKDKNAKAKPAILDPTGHPKGFNKGDSWRYAVWHDERGWHLRTTTKMVQHHFIGGIQVDSGTITKAHSFHLEKKGTLQDHWALDLPARQRLSFNFKTDKEMDGITFHVSKEAKHIIFNLTIDGQAHADRIFVGHAGHHPTTTPFTLLAHPQAKKK